MRLLTALAALALAGLAARADGDDPAAAAKKLDGTYEVVEVLTGGKPDKKKDEVRSFVIKDGEITIALGGGKDEAVKFAVDPAKKPAHLDITAGPKSVPGIYELKETDKGTELTIAFAKADRPKDFKGEGPDDVVMKLFRKKKG